MKKSFKLWENFHTVLMFIPHCKSLQRSLHARSKSAFKLLVLLVTFVSIVDSKLHIIYSESNAPTANYIVIINDPGLSLKKLIKQLKLTNLKKVC